MRSVTTIHQRFYKTSLPPITLEHVDLVSLTSRSVSDLIATLGDGTRLGVAASYGEKRVLKALAFSTDTRALLITMDDAQEQVQRQKQILRNELLCDITLEKHAFFMERLAAALHLDLGLFIRKAFDISSDGDRRGSMAAYKGVLARARTQDSIDESVVEQIFTEQPFILSRKNEFALSAWACYTGVQGIPEKMDSIDTSIKDSQELAWMCKYIRDADRLDSLKPLYFVNEISNDINVTKGTVDLRSTRYKTRIRQSADQHIRLGTDKNDVIGRVKNVRGKAVKVATNSQFTPNSQITSVVTLGKEELNYAEISRADLILDSFKGGDTLLSTPFVRKIFFPDYPLHTLKWPELPRTEPKINFDYQHLNESQRKAVEICLSNKEEDRHVVVAGPPGTGKTTIIAAIVQSKISEHKSNTIWVIAQSNVAVKNVAEKLAESGFLDFRLLVSREFHFDWHEHLYEAIRNNVIDSAQFKRTIRDNERLVLGARVVLCTTSMLSTDRVVDCGFTKIVPVQTIIVDEASQIEVGDYLPILARYKASLRKMIFIGDDKQLAPYGQEDIPELKSVFELPHLVSSSVFLDTQYRMPKVLGEFISRRIYHSKLDTVHIVTTQVCCRFVDVSNGEEMKEGNSWMNEGEVNAAVQIVKRYIEQERSFKVITPYDAQRNAIENALKSAGLAWENTVFNVDSFQGNEDDHIIVSVVRTTRPGFLVNRRRTNVMLSRCKMSLMILTNRWFVQKKAVANTLIGQFAKEHVPRTGWVTLEDLALHQW